MSYFNCNICLSLLKYILHLLKGKDISGFRLAATYTNLDRKLSWGKDGPSTVKRRYQLLVGKLIYLSHIKLDIVYVMGLLGQFMHDLREIHVRVAHHVFLYLKGTPQYGILF